MTTTSTNTPLDGNATLDDITRIINMHVQEGQAGAYVIGLLYNEVVDRRLAVIAGYKDARSYFAQNVKALSQTTLSVYGRAAKSFTQAVFTQHGPYKLNGLSAYAEAAGRTVPADPTGFLIAVPQDDGKVQDKPFEACSVDEIARATKARRAPPKATVPVTDQARLLFLAESLSQNFEGVAPVRMSSRCPSGKTLISLQDVPLAELQRLIQALEQGLAAAPTLGLKLVPASESAVAA